MDKLLKYEKTFIELDQLEKILNIAEYTELCNEIEKLIDSGRLKFVKSSGENGKNPSLYKKYKVIKEKEDFSGYLEELNYKISTKLDINYYKNNLSKYKEQRSYILQLNDFLNDKYCLLKREVSINERSFQIWGREKFLQRELGKSILKNLGLSLNYLNIYDSSEPLAYYSKTKKSPQNILIVENKDTYFTIRKYLINLDKLSLNKDAMGSILNEDIGTVIYGAGKRVIKSFEDYKISLEEHLLNKENKILYFGDLDYEGIVIYESFYKKFHKDFEILPFINGYEEMINKALREKIVLPESKEGQNKNIEKLFLNRFTEDCKEKINSILEENKYIPQE
ncbi:MAG: Wadjet anti-phage system protein JetD domain-containing protein [Sarcina sp.]